MQLTQHSYASLHGPYHVTLIWGRAAQGDPEPGSAVRDVAIQPFNGGDGETCEIPADSQVSDIGVIVQTCWVKSRRRNRTVACLAKEKTGQNFLPCVLGAVPGLSGFAIGAAALAGAFVLFRLPLIAAVPVLLLCLAVGHFYTARQTRKVVHEAQRVAAAQFRAQRNMNQRLKPRRRGLYVVKDVADIAAPDAAVPGLPHSG